MILSCPEYHESQRPRRSGSVRVRSTLDFASLDDHARMPARFFGRLVAASAAHLSSL